MQQLHIVELWNFKSDTAYLNIKLRDTVPSWMRHGNHFSFWPNQSEMSFTVLIWSVINTNRLLSFLIASVSCSISTVKRTWQQIKTKHKNIIPSDCYAFINRQHYRKYVHFLLNELQQTNMYCPFKKLHNWKNRCTQAAHYVCAVQHHPYCRYSFHPE